jgi:transglutaminase superfamily protein
MRRVRRFLLLSGQEKLLLFQAALLLSTTRAALALLPFQTVRRSLSRLARPKSKQPSQQSDIDRIVWATQAAVRRLPGIGTCLTQALTAYVLLGRIGYDTNLRIGVTRDDAGEFVAHAWLEKDDEVVIGELGEELQRYIPFPTLKGLER